MDTTSTGGIIVFFVIGLTINFFAKKNIKKGKVTFIDTKTGQTVNVGGEKLPDTFPKDFPIYQGAKVVSALSNIKQGKKNELLVTFTIPSGQGPNDDCCDTWR